ELLPSRTRPCRRRRGLLIAAHVREELDLHAAVLLAAVSCRVVGNRIVFADADEVEAVRGNVVLRSQVLNNCVSAALAQVIVVLSRSGRVGAAGNLEDVAFRRGKLAGEAV